MTLTRTPFRRWRDLGRKRHFPDPALRARLARLPKSTLGEQLLESYRRFDGWTVGEALQAERLCAPGKVAKGASVSVDGLLGLYRLFKAARGAEIKKPVLCLDSKSYLVVRDGEIRLHAREDDAFEGRVTSERNVHMVDGALRQLVADALSRLGEDPELYARRFQAGSGRCLFCNGEVSGMAWHPRCAAHWNIDVKRAKL